MDRGGEWSEVGSGQRWGVDKWDDWTEGTCRQSGQLDRGGERNPKLVYKSQVFRLPPLWHSRPIACMRSCHMISTVSDLPVVAPRTRYYIAFVSVTCY